LPARIVLSITSDIGIALANAWLDRGLTVAGTYRTESPALDELRGRGATLFPCDLSDRASVNTAVAALVKAVPNWDVLVVAPGTQEPVGAFVDCNFDEWEASISINFTAQLRAVHGLLPARRVTSERGPMVLMFAGGGTNNATKNYSAYTIAKIASIKMVELLDAEIGDTRFTILGPGWVKTKIHDATLAAGARAGANFERTKTMLASNDCVPIERVVECCDWMIDAPRAAIGGRNISLVYDCWDDPRLLRLLADEPDLYKLRRAGNDRMVRGAGLIEAGDPARVIGDILGALPTMTDRHAPATPLYTALQASVRNAAIALYGPGRRGPHPFGPFGKLEFPYRRMGAVDTLDLFGLDELILFAFYWANRGRYRCVADIGANIGLHSLLLARCGYRVRSYEPDPRHVAILKETLRVNGAAAVEIIAAAVSQQDGEAEFVRVLGNTTSSHLAGAKSNPYGELERFKVPLVAIAAIFGWADFAKIDAEGHEAAILTATTRAHWDKTDVMVEIGSPDNAKAAYEHLSRLGVGMFSQRHNWARIGCDADMPKSYRDGSLFISTKPAVPW